MISERKILVFSDCHGRLDGIVAAGKIHPDAGLYIFAGDGISVFESYCREKGIRYYAVEGNCDGSFFTSDEKTFTHAGLKFYLTHGNMVGTSSIISRAAEEDADIAIFGHTHRAYEETVPGEAMNREKNLLLLNPGSIALPRDIPGSPSFGLINIIAGIPITGIGRL